MRNLSNSTNLYKSGFVSLIPSSTYSDLTKLERTTVDTILEESYDSGRFLTGEQDAFPYIIVNMKNSYINLTSYSFYIRKPSPIEFRYPTSWDLYGMNGINVWKIIDSRKNADFNRDPTDAYNIMQNFTCQYPSIYNKFKIQATSSDSLNENIFTLSRLYFFGGFYPNFFIPTCMVNNCMYSLYSFDVFEIIIIIL